MIDESVREGFLFTLATIGVLVGLGATMIGAVVLWCQSADWRKKLSSNQAWITLRTAWRWLDRGCINLIHLIGTVLKVPFVWAWEKLCDKASEIVEVWEREQRRIKIGIGVATLFALPFILLLLSGVQLSLVVGIALAGATLGLVLSPVSAWYFRRDGVWKSVGLGVLSIPIGAWSSTTLILFLAAMTFD